MTLLISFSQAARVSAHNDEQQYLDDHANEPGLHQELAHVRLHLVYWRTPWTRYRPIAQKERDVIDWLDQEKRWDVGGCRRGGSARFQRLGLIDTHAQ